MSFDRTEHITGLLHKIKFYIVHGKMFLLIDSFHCSRRVEDYELPKSTSHVLSVPLIWNAPVCYLDPSLFFNCLPDDVLFLSELMIMLSNHHVTNHLTCRTKL